jgi:hypothetical protein
MARLKATAAGLSAKAKEHGSRFYQASITTAASTAEGIKRLAQGEPLQVCWVHPVLGSDMHRSSIRALTALRTMH